MTKRNPLVFSLGIAAIILATLVAVFYAARGTVYATLNAYQLLPAPERLTELYFENNTKLPKQTTAGVPLSFAFTIHNLEGTTTTYPYRVYFEDPDGTQAFLQGNTVSLANNASTTITVTHTFIASNLKGSVVVELANLGQTIDFLLK